MNRYDDLIDSRKGDRTDTIGRQFQEGSYYKDGLRDRNNGAGDMNHRDF